MGSNASQITNLTIVHSTVYSRSRSKKTLKFRVTGLCVGNSPVAGEFPAQRTNNAENVSFDDAIMTFVHHGTVWHRGNINSVESYHIFSHLISLMTIEHKPRHPYIAASSAYRSPQITRRYRSWIWLSHQDHIFSYPTQKENKKS